MGVIFLASIADVLNQWAALGVFAYILPFLIVFAVLYGILNKSKIFGENATAINVIISLAIALISIQFDVVPNFFASLFPALGVGLSVLLAAVILLGLFVNFGNANSPWNKYMPIAAGVIALIVVIVAFYQQGYPYGFGYGSFSGWWDMYGNAVVVGVILLGLIIAIIVGSRKTT